MRLLVDAQPVQSSSSLRGIGRYALCLLRALVQERGEDQVEVLLNGGDDPERLLRARLALETFLPPGAVHVVEAAWPWTPPYDALRRPAAEAAYLAAVRSLRPDAVLVLSPFEGDGETVLRIRPEASDPPTACVLYDLIPALDPGTYLLGPGADVYWRRFEEFRRSDALLAISRYSGRQAEALLGEACPPLTPVWGGPFPSGEFPAWEPGRDEQTELRLPERFLLTVGGDHPRKNLDRLVAAWAAVPADVRDGTALVVACRLNLGTVRRLHRAARRGGLQEGELVLTGGVSEATLRSLYTTARAFVFPSVEEGLGMPPLEAMAQGCPTVLARSSSLVELADDPEAFFDGADVDAMTAALSRLLHDDEHLARLRVTAARSAERFTWSASARLAWQALRRLPPPAHRNSRPTDGVVELAQPPVTGAPGPLGLPLQPRRELATATALVVRDTTTAREAVRAGLLDVAVVLPEDAVHLTDHDFVGEYRRALAPLLPLAGGHAEAVVTAALRAARWTLQRSRPVWLLLAEDLSAARDASRGEVRADVVVGAPGAVALAPSVDVVIVAVALGEPMLAALAHARRRGTAVVVLQSGQDPAVPAWCDSVHVTVSALDDESWSAAAAAAARSGRTTGWPWRDGA